MPLATFLSILGACVGFASALFFAVGTLRLRTREVADIARTSWDFNEHLADSIASQRAEYVVGAILLLLSFAAQLASNLVPSSIMLALLQSRGQALGAVVALMFLLGICAWVLTNVLAKSTQRAVRELLEQRTRRQP